MKQHFKKPANQRVSPRGALALVALLSCSVACTEGGALDEDLGDSSGGGNTTGGGGGAGLPTGGTGAGVGGDTVGSGGGGAEAACEGGDTVATKRVVRLSFNQVANTIASLVAPELGAQIMEEFELVDEEHRAFPPLQSAREGNSFTDQSWSSVDQIAQAAGDYVAANLEAVTGCAADPADECALDYLTALATSAYRRPLDSDEMDRLTTLYNTEFRGAGASASEAIQYGVYAIFQAPQFLYRTEFGAQTTVAGELTPLELASMISYFLTDDTPDKLLREAAEQGELVTEAQVGAQVDRILQTEAARNNLHGAMMSYFAYPNLENQIIQDDAFTGDMRASMYREAEMFLDDVLWSQPVEALLTSSTAYMNETLAGIYGVTEFPPLGATPVEDSFYAVELPDNRTGLLTQAGFLANRSRPDHTSVVGRGLLIKNAFLCIETASPPDAVLDAISTLETEHPDATERELAELRMDTPLCGNCHLSIDPFGLALDTFDVLGRYREVDAEGRAIDPSVTLPKEVGGGDAQNIVEVAQTLATSGAFEKCMGQNLVNYALADVSAGAATIDSCAVARVAEAFEATDGTFPSLVKTVVLSAVFRQRTLGVAQ